MFKEFQTAVDDFNEIFVDYFDEENLFDQALNYSIAQGKRLRPVLLIKCYEMIKNDQADSLVYDFAVALEMIHNYSLIHDDLPLMDDDDYRRGRLTVHKKYNEAIAVLAGDGLLNKAYEILFKAITRSENPLATARAAYFMARMAGIEGMIGGQVIDVLELSKDLDDICQMYDKKTSGLIKGATTSAAYLAGLEGEKIEDFTRLGHYIGMAFQLQDDLLDEDEDKKIDKKTYLSFTDRQRTHQAMLDFSKKALEIIEEYENKEFLETLIKQLTDRKF